MNHEIILQNIYNDKKLTFLLKQNPKEKQKIHVSLHICIFIHATRNYKQTNNNCTQHDDHSFVHAKAKV